MTNLITFQLNLLDVSAQKMVIRDWTPRKQNKVLLRNMDVFINTEIAVNIERLKLISKECPDMWKICDVQLIDPNAADYFTELDSMQRKEGGELEKKQDAFKHLHEHLILELVYFDKSNMIMHFGWCNHEEVISNQGFITCAYSQIGLK